MWEIFKTADLFSQKCGNTLLFNLLYCISNEPKKMNKHVLLSGMKEYWYVGTALHLT